MRTVGLSYSVWWCSNKIDMVIRHLIWVYLYLYLYSIFFLITEIPNTMRNLESPLSPLLKTKSQQFP